MNTRVFAIFFLLALLNLSFAFVDRNDQTPLMISHDFINPITDDISQKSVFEFSLKNAKSLFYWPCLVGTPPKEFNLLVDTGSSDLWLLLEECKSDACIERNKYSSERSITHRDMDDKENVEFEISYISTNVSGHFFFENMIMDLYVLKGQIFGGVAKEEGQDLLRNLPMDGIIGMGYPALASASTLKYKSFLQNFFQQNILPMNVFTLNFGKADGSGALTFGGINKDYLGSEVKYYPIKDTGYWQLELESIMIGDTKLNVCEEMKKLNGFCGAILDSGTTFLGIPQMFSDSIYTLIGATDPCDLARLPNITLVFQGDKYVFEPKDYASLTLQSTDQNLRTGQKCTLGILPVDIQPPKGPLFILGTLFLKKYYAIFDVDNHKIGFALIKPASKTRYTYDNYITTLENPVTAPQKEEPIKSTFLPYTIDDNGDDDWKLIAGGN